MQLSFGEQVKIVLKRQGITIKELASRIEEQTGKKMSRQNLTQRLGRDNFQEQDMFMVAQALGCSLTINLLDEEAPEELVRPAAVKAEPVAEPEEKVEAAPETPELDEEADFELDEFEEEELEEEELEEEELEVPEPAPTEAEKKESRFRTLNWRRRGDKQKEKAAAPAAEPPVEEPAQPEEPIEIEEPVMEEPIEIEETKSRDELMKELNADIAALGDSGPIILDDIPDRGRFETDPEAESAFQREKEALLLLQREDRHAELPPEQLPTTSINPYTLREYKSNTVRAHASRIGYVQVYSRQTHSWQDMTEWAFMGEQDRRKTLRGDRYEEPTYLD